MYSQYSGSVLDMFSLLGMLYGIYISYGRHFKQFKPQEYATVNFVAFYRHANKRTKGI